MQRPYFRLNYPSQATLDQLIASGGLAGLAPELGIMLRPGHIVLAARYDADRAVGHVRAMGRVVSSGSRLSVDWRPTRFDLHPTGSGQQFWKREHFNFAPAVAQRYGLAERAAGLFDKPPVPSGPSVEAAASAAGPGWSLAGLAPARRWGS